jgi:hypothetical protein
MNTTWYEKGLERGQEQGQRALLRDQLEERFGALSAAAAERLERLPPKELKALGKALLHAQSLRELGLEA